MTSRRPPPRPRVLPEHFSDEDDVQTLGTPRQAALGPTVRCLVWNILKARRRQWPADFAHLIVDRDLVLLQEAVLGAPSDALFRGSRRFEWIMARSFRNARSGVEHGVKTGCAAAAEQSRFFLSPHSEPLSNTQKLLLVTRYPLAGERTTLLVLNMHAINFVTLAKYASQLDQLESALCGHDGPVILAGDFNTWSPARLARFVDVAGRAGLTEAVMDRRCRLMHLNSHLDHVFYRGLTLRGIDSLGHIVSSDHAPITATFVREPASAGGDVATRSARAAEEPSPSEQT